MHVLVEKRVLTLRENPACHLCFRLKIAAYAAPNTKYHRTKKKTGGPSLACGPEPCLTVVKKKNRGTLLGLWPRAMPNCGHKKKTDWPGTKHGGALPGLRCKPNCGRARPI